MSEPILIVPTFLSKPEHANLIANCIESLVETSGNHEILIVDDCSPNHEVKKYVLENIEKRHSDKNISIIEKDENEGFSKTVNIGLRKALEQKRDACLINSDIQFNDPKWLEQMIRSEGEVVGAKLLYPNSTLQHAGIYFSPITRNFDHRYKCAPENLPAANIQFDCPVTGALQYIRYEVLEEVGVYDEDYRLSFEDVDFMLRALFAGFRSIYNPKVVAIHHEHAFRGGGSKKVKDWEMDSLRTLMTKWKDVSFDSVCPTMFEVSE